MSLFILGCSNTSLASQENQEGSIKKVSDTPYEEKQLVANETFKTFQSDIDEAACVTRGIQQKTNGTNLQNIDLKVTRNKAKVEGIDIAGCSVNPQKNNKSTLNIEIRLDANSIQQRAQYAIGIKDITSIIIAAIAITGLYLNLYTIKKTNKNRLEDKYSDVKAFWLKEIVYPEHLKYLIEDLYQLSNLYVEAIKNDDVKLKEAFLDYWRSHFEEMKNMVQNAISLPHFGALFNDVNDYLNDIEDKVCYIFYSEDIVVVPGVNVDKLRSKVNDVYKHENPFRDLLEFVYINIDES